MPMCRLADVCKGTMQRPFSGSVMVVPGIAFIALGLLIIVWPSVLPWLVATACILSGGAMLLMDSFMCGVGVRLRRAES